MSTSTSNKVMAALESIDILDQWVSRGRNSVSFTVCRDGDKELYAEVERIGDAMPDGVEVSIGEVSTVAGRGGLSLSVTLTIEWSDDEVMR